jgi:hypothetical protein
MYATIFQAETGNGVQQFAVVPDSNSPIVYTRRVVGHKQRGIAGAWAEVPYLDLSSFVGTTLGSPISLKITSSDSIQYQQTAKYTTLLQKLVRAIEGQTGHNPTPIADVATEVFDLASTNPAGLVQFTRALAGLQSFGNATVAEVAPVQPTPVAVVPEPAPIVSEVVAEVSEFISPDSPRQTSTELPRRYASLSVPKVNPAYIDREFDGVPLFTVYEKSQKRSRSVLATGDAGTGKSISVEQYAAHKGLPFVTVECSIEITTEITQGRLLPVPLPNGTSGWEWHYSELATAVQRPSVVLLNEFNRQSADSAPLWLGLLNERKLRIPYINEVIDVHPECLFVADQNHGSDYAGTQRQDSALTDRFHPKLEFEVDPNIESQLIPSETLLDFANALRFVNKTERAKLRTRVGLRMLLAFVKDVEDFGLKFAVTSFVNNFAEAERPSVLLQFDTRYDSIATELGVSPDSYTPSPSL